MEDELAVVLCEIITIDGKEESGDCDVLVEVLDLGVLEEDDIWEVMLEGNRMLELLELLELLEVLVLDVGLMVVVGTGVDETTIVGTELAVLVVTDVERDELVELVVETTVNEVLTSEQSVETQ